MEKIVPLRDHLLLSRFAPGDQVELNRRHYTVLRHTTLASGEPALVLQREGEQFVMAASKLKDRLEGKN